MDEEVIAQAKRLAAERGTSVSAMFARLVRAMAAPQKGTSRIGPITRRATGLVTLPAGKTDGEILQEALSDRYGLRR